MPEKTRTIRNSGRRRSSAVGGQTASMGVNPVGTPSVLKTNTTLDLALANIRHSCALAYQIGASQTDITGVVSKGFKEGWPTF